MGGAYANHFRFHMRDVLHNVRNHTATISDVIGCNKEYYANLQVCANVQTFASFCNILFYFTCANNLTAVLRRIHTRYGAVRHGTVSGVDPVRLSRRTMPQYAPTCPCRTTKEPVGVYRTARAGLRWVLLMLQH